ncbi:hypothetical protein HD598_000742 [Neomicrococcus aestuarii]|jgi:hypothetical protein|uniref:Uncharacterized protein n=1 Tax=Neomicrococcus aestuarii TaxID=556325 RepID=A0A7W8TSG7_9MICC|nr:hypothetical protein [Neomicrococcus aestuarii]MBB5512055.1 hypothetical protein [Neomicrococcus aestuarii]
MLNLVTAAEAAAEAEGAGLLPYMIGGGIFVFFMVLLFVTLSFSNVGLRHEAHAQVNNPHKPVPHHHQDAVDQRHGH